MNNQAGGIAAPQKVRGTFASSEHMQDAVSRLSMSGFDRADISLPSPGLVRGDETLETGTKPASTDADARQARSLGASTAGAAAALAAAGVVIGTGGAAAPAVAAAIGAGGLVGGGVFAAHGTADVVEQHDRDDRAATGNLVLAVRAATEAKRAEAEGILRAAGATHIEAVP